MDVSKLSDLTYETTREWKGETFEVRLANGETIETRLTEVDVLLEKHVNPRMRRDTFAMRFTGPVTPRLPQGTYTFHNERLGAFPLFIVALGVDSAGTLYEAIFT
jgi:hypothetical protein